MATMRAIKKRISSVNNTKKLMKAMDLIAASKLQKAKARFEDILPLCDSIKLVMESIKANMSQVSAVENPEESETEEIAFAQEREVKDIAYIVLTGDRGLCGGYNVNVSRAAFKLIVANKDKNESILTIGSKGSDYFKRRGKNIVFKCYAASEATTFEDAELIGKRVSSMYKSGDVDEVYLIYTHFETLLSHTPRVEKLLPLKREPDGEDSFRKVEMNYDPDVGTFISYAVPMYLNITIYSAMLESALCEFAARMTSMDAATRNATEIIDDLTLKYNRKRQGLITQEITEIISGANAFR